MANNFYLPLVLCLFVTNAWGQTPSDYERRIAELEAKVRELDQKLSAVLGNPTFAAAATSAPSASIQTAPVQVVPVSGPALSALPIVPVSVSGDYQKSLNAETRLPVAGYMDFHVNKLGEDPFQPDFHRFVLLFGHSFSDRIKFWSELELEHSILEPSEGTGGELELEQAYLDFFVKPYFNLRAGMVLTPIGIVNERHEPPSFNGVERPFVETKIIPTTWRELGAGVTGDLGRGFRYRGYMTSALDATRFDAESGIGGGVTKGFESSMRNPAKSIRVEYTGVRRLTSGISYYTGLTGFNLNALNPRLDMLELDARYSYKRFDMRGLFVNSWLSKAGELNRQMQLMTGVSPNVASQMRGYYFEPGFHVLPRRETFDLVAFARYERYNTQQVMPAGYLPLQQFNRSTWVTGITFKPTPDVAVKFDYNFNNNESAVVRAVNGINLGLGWWF